MLDFGKQSVAGADWADVVIETVFELRTNPHHVSAAGVAFRAQDPLNAYMVEIALDGTFRLMRRRNGEDETLREKRLAAPLTDGVRYALTIEARGTRLTTRLDDVTIDESRDDLYPVGRVGFYTPKEKWPLFGAIRVTDGEGRPLLADDFSGALSRWQFARTLLLTLTVPPETCAEVIVPSGGTVWVNGEPGDVGQLGPGSYAIEVRDLPAGAWADPTNDDRPPSKGETVVELKPVSSDFPISSENEPALFRAVARASRP